MSNEAQNGNFAKPMLCDAFFNAKKNYKNEKEKYN